MGSARLNRPVSFQAALLAPLAVAIGLALALQPVGMAGALLATALGAWLALLTPIVPLVALLILAPLRTLIATEAPIALPLDIGQLALIAALGIWLAHRLARRERLLAVAWSPVLLPVVVFVLATGLTAFSAYSLGAWLNEWLKWVQVLLLIVVVLHAGQGERWRWLVFGLALAGAANALIGLYEFFGGSGALHLLINDRFFRAFGTFGQPNPFGGFMGLLAPLVLCTTLSHALALWRDWRMQRLRLPGVLWTLFYAGASGLIVVGVFISWSRGAWLGFAAAMAAVVFALPRRLWQSIALVATLAALVGGLWLAGRLPASVVARVSSATQELFAFDDVRGVDITPENYAVVERLAHWQAALNMARAHPWLGVGFVNYEIAYADFRLMNWKFPLGHAHNYYLNVLAEAGMIGLIAYVFYWAVVVFLTWHARRHPDDGARFTSIGLLGTWIYLLVHSLTDNLYVNNLFLHIGVMLGILAIIVSQRKGLRLRMSWVR